MAIEPILEALREGQHAIFHTGRALDDLHLNELGEPRPLIHTLTRHLWREHGMALIRCNLALGAVPEFWPLSPGARSKIEEQLREADACALLPGATPAENRHPFERVLDALRVIHKAATEGRKLPPCLVVFEFAEDLTPSGANLHALPQLTEMVRLVAAEFRLRSQEILIIFSGSETLIDERVQRSLHSVRLPQPGVEEKAAFTTALLASKLRKGSQLEAGLDIAGVASLSAGTPNIGLEHLIRASARTGRPVTAAALVRQKREDVVRLSGGTLESLDTARIHGVSLEGRTVARAMALLEKWAELIHLGETWVPANVLLAGAPSTGKTDMALIAAARGRIPAYAIISAKDGIVGSTERRVRLQMWLLLEMYPCMGFVDEITLAMPTRSSRHNLDSGASDAILAEWQNQLADRTREGRVLLVGTTNRPYDMQEALSSRFTVLPVLSPVAEDYPAILRSLLRKLAPHFELDEDELRDAAALFAQKAIIARRIHAVLRNNLAATSGRVGSGFTFAAARDAVPASPSERLAAEHADLAAILHTTQTSFFPWMRIGGSNQVERDPSFELPEYLARVVADDGVPDRDAVCRRMAKLANEI